MAIFITITGFILNTKHIIAINLIFSSSVIYIAIISAPSYISNNALFLVLMLTGFSYGVIIFRSSLISSLKQNDELNRKILLKEEALNTEKALRLEETINNGVFTINGNVTLKNLTNNSDKTISLQGSSTLTIEE